MNLKKALGVSALALAFAASVAPASNAADVSVFDIAKSGMVATQAGDERLTRAEVAEIKGETYDRKNWHDPENARTHNDVTPWTLGEYESMNDFKHGDSDAADM